MNEELKVGYFCLAVVISIIAIAVTQSVLWGIGGFFSGYGLALLNEIRKAQEEDF